MKICVVALLSALVALPSSLVAQDGPSVASIGKSNAARYRSALTKYKEAEEALATGDVSTAFDKAGEIVEDPKIESKNRECLLRIQNSDSTWNTPESFFPVRVHAKAGLERAKKSLAEDKKEDGIAKLQAAKTEIQESVARRIPGAPEILKEIDELIAANSSNEEDPVVKKRRAYEAKLSAALSAEVGGDIAGAKAAYLEALGIDAEGAKAKEGVARMEARLREEEAFVSLAALPDADDGRKIAACDEFLKAFPTGVRVSEVQGLRARLTRAIADSTARRESEFRDEWLTLRNSGKFRSALELIAGKGASILNATQSADLAAQTSSACEAFILDEVRNFRLNLANLDSLEILAGRSGDSLDRDLALPDAAEIVTKSAALDWCRAYRGALDRVRKLGADAPAIEVLAALDDAWKTSPGLVDPGENGFFRSAETLIRSAADNTLGALVRSSRSATSQDLAVIRDEAHAIVTGLDQLDAALGAALASHPDKGAAWRDRHAFWRRDLFALKSRLDEFPRDAAEIDALGRQLSDWQNPEGAFGRSPLAALARIESDLKRIRKKEGPKLSRDSLRKLLTFGAAAAALGHLVEGRTVEETARELEDYGAELKPAGGAIPGAVKELGPKLQKVFALLAK